MTRFRWLKTPQGPQNAYERQVYEWNARWHPDIRRQWRNYRTYYIREFERERR